MVNWSEPVNGDHYLLPTNPFIPFTKTALEQSLSARFEQQVSLYPERIAVKDRGKAISYRSLNRMANRVAWALLQACGEEQKPVALLLENGEGVIRGGSWRDDAVGPAARAVYSPLWQERDPQFPKSRWWLSDGPFIGFRIIREAS